MTFGLRVMMGSMKKVYVEKPGISSTHDQFKYVWLIRVSPGRIFQKAFPTWMHSAEICTSPLFGLPWYPVLPFSIHRDQNCNIPFACQPVEGVGSVFNELGELPFDFAPSLFGVLKN